MDGKIFVSLLLIIPLLLLHLLLKSSSASLIQDGAWCLHQGIELVLSILQHSVLGGFPRATCLGKLLQNVYSYSLKEEF